MILLEGDTEGHIDIDTVSGFEFKEPVHSNFNTGYIKVHSRISGTITVKYSGNNAHRFDLDKTTLLEAKAAYDNRVKPQFGTD